MLCPPNSGDISIQATPHFVDDSLHASTILLIQTSGRWSYTDALAFVDAADYVADADIDGTSEWIGVLDDGQWLHIAEGFDYRIYYRPDRNQRFCELSREFDVFWFCLGDADMSFNYALFRDGKCVREVVVNSPNYDDHIVVANKGELLSGEERIFAPGGDTLLLKDADQYMPTLLHLASELGAKTEYTNRSFSYFRSPGAKRMSIAGYWSEFLRRIRTR